MKTSFLILIFAILFTVEGFAQACICGQAFGPGNTFCDQTLNVCIDPVTGVLRRIPFYTFWASHEQQLEWQNNEVAAMLAQMTAQVSAEIVGAHYYTVVGAIPLESGGIIAKNGYVPLAVMAFCSGLMPLGDMLAITTILTMWLMVIGMSFGWTTSITSTLWNIKSRKFWIDLAKAVRAAMSDVVTSVYKMRYKLLYLWVTTIIVFISGNLGRVVWLWYENEIVFNSLHTTMYFWMLVLYLGAISPILVFVTQKFVAWANSCGYKRISPNMAAVALAIVAIVVVASCIWVDNDLRTVAYNTAPEFLQVGWKALKELIA